MATVRSPRTPGGDQILSIVGDAGAAEETGLDQLPRFLVALANIHFEQAQILEQQIRQSEEQRDREGVKTLRLTRDVALERSTRLLEEALSKDAYDPRIQIALARIAIQRGEMERALEHSGLAVQTAPRNPEILISRAQILEEVGRLEEALRDLGSP